MEPLLTNIIFDYYQPTSEAVLLCNWYKQQRQMSLICSGRGSTVITANLILELNEVAS